MEDVLRLEYIELELDNTVNNNPSKVKYYGVENLQFRDISENNGKPIVTIINTSFKKIIKLLKESQIEGFKGINKDISIEQTYTLRL